jgi:hypothetical protein
MNFSNPAGVSGIGSTPRVGKPRLHLRVGERPALRAIYRVLVSEKTAKSVGLPVKA